MKGRGRVLRPRGVERVSGGVRAHDRGEGHRRPRREDEDGTRVARSAPPVAFVRRRLALDPILSARLISIHPPSTLALAPPLRSSTSATTRSPRRGRRLDARRATRRRRASTSRRRRKTSPPRAPRSPRRRPSSTTDSPRSAASRSGSRPSRRRRSARTRSSRRRRARRRRPPRRRFERGSRWTPRARERPRRPPPSRSRPPPWVSRSGRRADETRWARERRVRIARKGGDARGARMTIRWT